MPLPTLNLTETQELAALNTFLTQLVTPTVSVILGQVNRVAEPSNADFIVYWPLRQVRLSMNIVTFQDNIVTASIAGAVMDVTAIPQAEGPIGPGVTVTDGSLGAIAAGTVVVDQLSGSIGGVGTYTVAPPQTLAAGTLYVGTRSDFEPVEWVVQLDVHGPNSADNVRVIETIFRSELGVQIFDPGETDGLIQPLYADEARQVPFINAEEQYENRWTLDVHLQINPTVGTTQQFAGVLTPTTIPADS